MITIISASNREDNLTASYSKRCKDQLQANKIECKSFYLDEIPDQISLQSVYDYGNSIFTKYGEELILPADKLLFVVPEYNGSIPGILKLFIDGIEPKYFKGKKAALVGVSSGRAGNLRGMDHLTDILHHLQVNVMPQKLPISKMQEMMGEGEVADKETLQAINWQMDLLINY